MAKVFDISHWNSTADFATARAAGEEGVYLKATEGAEYTDPTFSARWNEAKAAGILRGAYLFFNPQHDTVEQVNRFLQVIGKNSELKAALDWEDSKGVPAHVGAAKALHALQLLEAALGYKPLLYTYRSFAEEGYCAGLQDYPLWLADYSGTEHVPAPWHTAVAWQTGQAHVAGVAAGDGSGVDVDTVQDLAAIETHPVVHAAGHVGAEVDSPLLQLGNHGPQVQDVQRVYVTLGNDIKVDGIFGPVMDHLTRVFQEHRNLKVTGTITPETWVELRKIAHPAS